MECSRDCISWSQWSCTIYSSCVIFTSHQLYANEHAHGIFMKITAENKVLFFQNIKKILNISDYPNITQWPALNEPHVFQLIFSIFPIWRCSWWGSSLILDLEDRQRERRPKFTGAFVSTKGTNILSQCKVPNLWIFRSSEQLYHLNFHENLKLWRLLIGISQLKRGENNRKGKEKGTWMTGERR